MTKQVLIYIFSAAIFCTTNIAFTSDDSLNTVLKHEDENKRRRIASDVIFDTSLSFRIFPQVPVESKPRQLLDEVLKVQRSSSNSVPIFTNDIIENFPYELAVHICRKLNLNEIKAFSEVNKKLNYLVGGQILVLAAAQQLNPLVDISRETTELYQFYTKAIFSGNFKFKTYKKDTAEYQYCKQYGITNEGKIITPDDPEHLDIALYPPIQSEDEVNYESDIDTYFGADENKIHVIRKKLLEQSIDAHDSYITMISADTSTIIGCIVDNKSQKAAFKCTNQGDVIPLLPCPVLPSFLAYESEPSYVNFNGNVIGGIIQGCAPAIWVDSNHPFVIKDFPKLKAKAGTQLKDIYLNRLYAISPDGKSVSGHGKDTNKFRKSRGKAKDICWTITFNDNKKIAKKKKESAAVSNKRKRENNN